MSVFCCLCVGYLYPEVPVGIEPAIEVLQTPALPLGYGTMYNLNDIRTHRIAQ